MRIARDGTQKRSAEQAYTVISAWSIARAAKESMTDSYEIKNSLIE